MLLSLQHSFAYDWQNLADTGCSMLSIIVVTREVVILPAYCNSLTGLLKMLVVANSTGLILCVLNRRYVYAVSLQLKYLALTPDTVYVGKYHCFHSYQCCVTKVCHS